MTTINTLNTIAQTNAMVAIANADTCACPMWVLWVLVAMLVALVVAVVAMVVWSER